MMTKRTTPTPAGGHRSTKQELRGLLNRRELAAYQTWAARHRNPLRTLHMLLWDSDPLIRWRAIEAIGELTEKFGASDIAGLREFVRKLFWSMNDESGSLCPHAPEAIAEIMFRSAPLRQEFLELWLSFLDEEPFGAGMRAGIARICTADITASEKALIQEKLPELLASLHSDLPEIRGLAARAVQSLGHTLPNHVLASLAADRAPIAWYDFASGELTTRSIAQLSQ